jgi:hypothetical protein
MENSWKFLLVWGVGKEYIIHKIKKNEKGEKKLGDEATTIKFCPFCGA